MSEPTIIRAQATATGANVRVLLRHEMETGQRKDASGNTVPAWYIQELVATWNGQPVLRADWGTGISKNPFLQFTVLAAKAGDKIAIAWKDTRGQTRTDEAVVT